MKLKLIFVFFILIQIKSFSQSIYLKLDKNISRFDFVSSEGKMDSDIQSNIGSGFEVGYSTLLYKKHPRFSYSGGITYNEFNASVGTSANLIKWQTVYLGVKNSITYTFIKIKKGSLGIKLGQNISKLIFGKEEVNGILFDIKNQKDFKGILLQNVAGLEVKYLISKNVDFGLGYNYMYSIDLASKAPQKFSIVTQQLSTTLYFKFN
jgi:uncharacterized protein YueI